MFNAVIGALRVTLGMDSAQFEQNATRAQARLASIGRGLATAATAATAAVTAASGAMAVAVRAAVHDFDNLAKTSQKIGVPVEDLSQLRHAAELSGAGLDTLEKSLGRLSKNLNDVAAGVGQNAARAFEAIGVAVTNADGSLRSTSDVMSDVADRFAGMEDGAQKTAIAMDLFGRSGTDLIPMLNQGSAGIAAMKQEADQLGLTISQNTGAAAEQFNDNLDRLGKIFQGLVNEVAARVLPTLVQLSEDFLSTAGSADGLKQVADFLTQAFRFVVIAGREVAFVVNRIGAELSAVGEAAKLLAQGEFAAAFDRYYAEGERTAELWAKLREENRRIWEEGVSRPIEQAAQVTAQSVRQVTQPVTELGDAAVDVNKRIADAFDTLKQGATETGETVRVAVGEPLKLVPDDVEQIGHASNRVADLMQNSLVSTVDKLVDGTFDAKEAVVDLLKDFNRLLLNTAFQAFLGGASGPGAGGGILASLFGGGAALPGFASGGSFEVGGSGGVDSQIVAFRATPGEKVAVSNGPNGGFGGGGNVSVNVFAPPGTNPQTRQRQTAGGLELDVIIDQAVADRMGNPNSAIRKAGGRVAGMQTPIKGR